MLKKKNFKSTYLPLSVDDLSWILDKNLPLLEGEQSMANKIFPVADLHYELRGKLNW